MQETAVLVGRWAGNQCRAKCSVGSGSCWYGASGVSGYPLGQLYDRQPGVRDRAVWEPQEKWE